MRCAVVLLIVSLSSCIPYSRQLALISPSPINYGLTPYDRISGSQQPLYRVKNRTGDIVANVACYGPLLYQPLQGPIGSLVFIRTGSTVVEIEAILRPSLSKENLAAIEAVVPFDTVLIPCPQDVLRISPLAQLPFDAETSFASGRDGQNTDILVIRVRVGCRDESNLRRMVASAIGLSFELTYRISGSSEEESAVVQLRSGTGVP
jgi:hypothetical protein